MPSGTNLAQSRLIGSIGNSFNFNEQALLLEGLDTHEIEASRIRQAVDSLRGYLYQVIASANAWVSLAEDEVLKLEVAEDYALLAHRALTGVQIKHQTAALTSNSPEVVASINSLFELSALNPDRLVVIRHLTTASIGLEKSVDDRVGGTATLEYWRAAADSAEIDPLRKRLLCLPLSEAAQNFLRTAKDEDVRSDLVRRIDWVGDQPGIEGLRSRLAEMLIYHGSNHAVGPTDSARTASSLIQHVFEVIVRKDPKARTLRRVDFLKAFEDATAVTVPRGLLGGLAAPSDAAGNMSAKTSVVSNLGPLTGTFANRPEILDDIRDRLAKVGLAWLQGGAGYGKTVVASQAAEALGGTWIIARLRDTTAAHTPASLRQTAAATAMLRPRGLILDDLEIGGWSRLEGDLKELLRTARQFDCSVIVTSSHAAGARLCDLAGIRGDPNIGIGALSESEVSALVAELGGNPAVWRRYVFLGGGAGNAQLVHAIALGLARRGWPKAEISTLSALRGKNEDLEEVRAEARKRLTAELPLAARRLLFRLTVCMGTISRSEVETVAKVDPPIDMPGEVLDNLVGPWVEKTERGFRVSPLVANAAATLGEAETKAVHYSLAVALAMKRELDGDKVDDIILHGIAGDCDAAIMRLCMALLMTDTEELALILNNSVTLMSLAIGSALLRDRPLPAIMLSVMQVLGAAARGDREQLAETYETLVGLKLEGKAAQLESTKLELLLPKLLTMKGLIDIVDDLPKMIVDARATIMRSFGLPQAAQPIDAMKPVVGFQLYSATRVESLARFFTKLKDLGQEDRNVVLDFGDEKLVDKTMLVRGPFLAAIQSDDQPPPQLVTQYIDLGRSLAADGLTDLAVVAYETASVIQDEYEDAGEQAQATIDEAINRLGALPDLLRLRARVQFHAGDFEGQLSTIDEIANRFQGGEITRAYYLREAAVANSMMQRHDEAARLFGEAADAARLSSLEGMQVMSIGLKADGAAELFQSRKPREALDQLADALADICAHGLSLPGAAAATSKFIAHFAVNFMDQVVGGTIRFEDMAGFISGAASDPRVNDAIQNPPMPGLIDIVWATLSQVESRLNLGYVFIDSIRGGKVAGELPTMLRAVALIEAVRSTIRCSDYYKFGTLSAECADAFSFIETIRQNPPALFEAAIDPIPQLSPALLAKTTGKSFHMLTALTIRLADEGRFGDVDRLFAQLSQGGRARISSEAKEAYRQAAISSSMDLVPWVGRLGAYVKSVRSGGAATLDELLILTIRMLESCAHSEMPEDTAPPLSRWSRDQWRQAIDGQSFRLQTPVLARTSITTALEGFEPSIRWIAHLCLTLLPFVRLKVDTTLREVLVQLRDGL